MSVHRKKRFPIALSSQPSLRGYDFLLEMENETDFDDIFRLYYSQLYIFAFQMINDEEECNDIVNSAYECVWNNFKKMDRSTVKAFLYASVRNRCIDYLRHRDVHNQYVEFCQKQYEEEAGDDDSSLDLDYRIVCIRELMQHLPPTTKYILEACYIEQKKYREVAEEMNLTTHAVKKQLMKALQMLREKIAKKW